MKPVDRRLLRYAGAARAFFGVGAVLGVAQAACIVAFAWLVSSVVVSAIGGQTLGQLGVSLVALVAVVLVRSGLAWLMEVNSARGATVVKSQLRREVLAALPKLGPSWLSTRNSVRVSTVVTSGLDALDTYFSKYLPQLILTVIVTPVVLVVLFLWDWESGLTVLLTLPLIPLFMVLIGWATQKAQKDQWQQLGRLSSGFLDVVEGLSTLKVFGREKRQTARIRAVTDEYRVTTMKVLRMSFLSGFALELAASLAVALVAVSVGLRLVSGDLGLGVGLFVLVLAPEAFLPLRQVGAQFHAAADGVAATDDVFEILEAGERVRVRVPVASALSSSPWAGGAGGAGAEGADAAAGAVDAAAAGAADATAAEKGDGLALAVDDVTVRYGGDVAVRGFHARFEMGTVTAISGPSGAGKSSLVAALLGFVDFDGRVGVVGDAQAAPLKRESVAWAGQRPGLMAGTIASNVALGSAASSGARATAEPLIAQALRLAAAGDLDPTTVLGVNGAGLSGGQAQRVAVARAFYRALDRACPVVVLDEPSSALDAGTETALIAGVREMAERGHIVIVVSHRRAFHEAADRVVEMVRPDRD
ncbi:MAG: transporter ATP-binding protein, partial [Subtercola sp.]|nr:transporter ATP-binding protein [Subtercola sp.]